MQVRCERALPMLGVWSDANGLRLAGVLLAGCNKSPPGTEPRIAGRGAYYDPNGSVRTLGYQGRNPQ
jgi:hypothetical protein